MGSSVAVVMSTYNGAAHLADALDSVARQTQPPAEFVVVDDGSTDETIDVLHRHGISPLKPGHAGAPAARNTGRQALVTNPDYVLFLDQDDILDRQMLETLSQYLDTHPTAGMVCCDFDVIGAAGHPISNPGGWRPRHAPGRVGRARRLADHEPVTPMLSIIDLVAVLPSSALVRLTSFDRAGGWDETLERGGAADTALAVEIALLGEVHFLPLKLLRYRWHDSQESAGRARLAHAQDELFDHLRQRREPEIRQAFRDYDRQLVLGRHARLVRRAVRERRWSAAARTVTQAAGQALRRH